MPTRRIAALVSPVITFIEWLFSELAPGVDLFLALLGSAWLTLMVSRSDVFDHGNLAGMQWLPDRVWIGFVALTVALHVVGLVRPGSIKLRVAALLITSWYWLLVAISLGRIGLSPGIFTYALIGAVSLCSAIYVSGRLRRGG